MGGAYGPPWEKLPGNSKLVRAEGPGFWDFYFNLVLHVSAKKLKHFDDPVRNYTGFVGRG